MTNVKKLMSIILAISIAFTLLAGFEISASAANVEVSIVSFLRGAQDDLRSSELLEARVTGYEGNVRELTYEWTNEIGTYLYVYNNHNMYGINNTSGEIEIYNDEIEPSSNMSGRTYDTTFSGTGFAWAAIYGANYNNADLLGTITVRVYDREGNLLATDSHEGTRVRTGGSNKNPRYKYYGFVEDSLEGDLTATNFGIFEGDSKFIKELFSESSIVHITCEASTIDGANIVSGRDYISLVNNYDGTYTVTALKPGKAVLNMDVSKDNCKFHQYTSGETDVTIYVYKRPEPTPTTTTITLTNLDEDCTYYIDGVEGTYQEDGTVIFTGLTPNTTYTIEAKGQAEGTAPVYAYTTCTTLPVYNATVYVILNGGFNAETNTAYGTPVNISDIRDTDDAIYIKELNGSEFIELTHADTGVYTAGVSNGTYLIYRDPVEDSNPSTQQLIVDNADKARYLFYYSVDYDAAGGEGAPEIAYYYEGTTVKVTDVIPTREGYNFVAWQDEDGVMYAPGATLTGDIEKAYNLTAIWEEAVDVYVNIVLVHTDIGGSEINRSEEKHNIVFTIDGRAKSGDYTELADRSIFWDGAEAFDTEGYEAEYQTDTEKTVYTATAPTFTNLPRGMEYTFTSAKTGYELVELLTETYENGDVVLTAIMQYDVNNFDLTFEVELDEAAKALPDSLKPIAADVKVTAWYDSPYADGNDVDWYPIMQHKETYVKVSLDEQGYGIATYPVWATNLAENLVYYYRIEVVSFVLPDGSVMTAENVDNAHEIYRTEDERYSATVEVTGGMEPDGSALAGAWFDEEQKGNVKAVISIEVFDVTFDPAGGAFSDGTTDNKVAEKQIAIPSFDEYIPTREGGYTFAGWYYEGTDEKAIEGTVLFKDETLVARWKEPLVIEGTVSVAGTYELESTQVIYDNDRITSVHVLLRHIDSNGYESTTESKVIPITYEGNLGMGTYSFTIPDDGHEHHISVTSANYKTAYQNELSESVNVNDYWAYTLDHGEAEFNGDNVAMVNAYLAFDPVTFPLQYEIDATAMGEGFRPENVETLVLCDDGQHGNNPQGWAVISQMAFGEGYEGQITALAEGLGSDSYEVWNSKADGATLYDYAIRVKAVDGVDFNIQEAPMVISYNGSARYSALNGQTQILTATIVPKMYTITFDLNAGEDVVTGMEKYDNVIGAFQDTYYYSYGKSITAKPVRDGYTFLGWFDENGNEITDVAPEMHENITVTAQWEKLPDYKNDYAYIFGYNDAVMGAEGPLLRCELSAMVHRLVKQNGKLGDFVYNAGTPSFDDIAGQWFQSGIEYMNHKGALAEGASAQPYVEVTRGEAFKYICLGLGFVEDTTLTNQQYADFLYNAGYIIGDGSGDLKVDDLITRAEFCTMYNRIIGRENALLIDTDGNPVTAETYGFTDMTDKSVWYYENMVRATSAYEGEYVSIEKRGIRNVLDDYAG